MPGSSIAALQGILTFVAVGRARAGTTKDWVAVLAQSGGHPDPEKPLRHQDRKPGVYRSGP